MAWDVVICPTKRGSLGIIDPICQSRAMMVKFIVRGLLLGRKLWKAMLYSRMQQCAPKQGKPWPISFRWLFAKDPFFHSNYGWYDKFFWGISKAWRCVKGFLEENPFTVEDNS